MILLQILAALCLLPSTLLLVLVFFVYVSTRTYHLCILLFFSVYAFLVGIIAINSHVSLFVLVGLTAVYLVHCLSLHRRHNWAKPGAPVLHGTIKNHRINCIFVIKMSVLKLITLLPKKLFQRGPANSPLQFDFRQLIQMIATQSKGTICNMVSEHNTCIIEIK